MSLYIVWCDNNDNKYKYVDDTEIAMTVTLSRKDDGQYFPKLDYQDYMYVDICKVRYNDWEDAWSICDEQGHKTTCCWSFV